MKKNIVALLVAALVGLAACFSDTGRPASASEPESSSGVSVMEKTPTPEPAKGPAFLPVENPPIEAVSAPTGMKRVKMTVYGPRNELLYWHEYAYNQAGDVSRVTSYNADGNQTGYVDLHYDEEGRVLENYSWENPTYVWVNDTAINQNESVGMVYLRSCGSTDEYEDECIYDSTGKIVKTIAFNKKGNVSTIYEHEYNEFGKESAVTAYYLDGVPEKTVCKKFDFGNKWIKSVMNHILEQVERTVKRFTLNHACWHEIFLPAGSRILRERTEYAYE